MDAVEKQPAQGWWRRWMRRAGPHPPQIGLAFGGGFARGIAHIGVLRALEKSNIPICAVAGVSSGAIMAAAVASGATSDDIEMVALSMKFRDVARWTLNLMGLAGSDRMITFLARLLKARVAYHHSGLSYAVRAGVIEPLAKAGQLRVVVATMGLAAGINFSLRSVALAGESYRRDAVEEPIRPDEILQMFGRAGRRGLDETGFVLITANELRLLDARPCQLSRSGAVDWSALLNLMAVAAQQGRDPFTEAVFAQ